MPPEELKVIQRRFGEHFLWARRSGKTYVSSDANTIRDALGLLQRNVKRGAETDRHLAAVIDAAVRSGAARQVQ